MALCPGDRAEPITETGDVDLLLELFGTEEVFQPMGELTQLSVLVQAIRISAGYEATEDHPRLAQILERILAFDPKVSKDIMRQRDMLLWTLSTAVGNPDTLKRMRAAARTPHVRSDMMKLQRDITREMRAAEATS